MVSYYQTLVLIFLSYIFNEILSAQLKLDLNYVFYGDKTIYLKPLLNSFT